MVDDRERQTQMEAKSIKRHCMVVHAHYPLGEPRVEREARALIRRGYEVDVICLRGDEEQPFEEVDGVDVYRLHVKRHKQHGPAVQLLEYLAFFLLAFFKLVVLQLRRRYIVIQVHNLPDFLVFATLVPKFAGVRVILDIHDLMPEFFASSFRSSMSSWPVRMLIWQEQLSCRFADHIITVTESWRETLIKRGVPPEKVTVVMNVADNRVFHAASSTKQPTNGNERFNLIYHGSLTKRYGLDLLVKAVGTARHEIPDIHLTIHGRGEFYPELVELVDELHLEEQIRFSTKLIPIEELPDLIRQADLGVVPYRGDIFTDGILPTKLMEYSALNVPVIASRTGAISEYFDETMVKFVNPGDLSSLVEGIMDLFRDRNQLSHYAENAKKFNQQFSWEKVSAGYVALVDGLSNSGRLKSN